MSACSRLLKLYDGVTIDHVLHRPSGAASIILRIADITTVARLAYHASDACIEFAVWPVGHNGPMPDGLEDSNRRDRSNAEWASRIQYQLRAGPTSSEESGLRVVTFSVCMVEELVFPERLPREEADQ